MHTHMSHHNTVPQHSYGSSGAGGYNYSPSMYNGASFSAPYNTGTMQVAHVATSGSPQDYQGLATRGSPQDYPGFSVPPYHSAPDQVPQYLTGATTTRNTVLPSESSTADSNGSIVSEFDANKNPVKKRRKPAPTIATGRRNLKEESVNTEEADRRDKRRERNRKSAQRCRERKIEKKDALEQQISDTNVTCSRYIELAENVLKAWKQRLHLLQEKLPSHNYKSQLSVADFEQLIEMMHSRKKDASEAGDSGQSVVDTSGCPMTKHNEYGALQPQMNSTFLSCSKMEPYFPPYNNDEGTVLVNQADFEHYHNCIQESNISYI